MGITDIRAEIDKHKARLTKLKDGFAKAPPEKAIPALLNELNGTVLSILGDLALEVEQGQLAVHHLAGVVDEILDQPDEIIGPETLALVTAAFVAGDAAIAELARLLESQDDVTRGRVQPLIAAYEAAKGDAVGVLTELASDLDDEDEDDGTDTDTDELPPGEGS